MQTVTLSSFLLIVCCCYVNCNPSGMAFQKRQSLIPFPRVGRSRSITANNKLPLISASRTFQWDDLREGKRHLIPFPRVGKRQSLIPFPRVGRNDPFRDYSDLIKQEDDDTSMTAGDISDDSYIQERRKRSTSDTMRTDEASIFNSGQRDGGWTKMLVPRLNPSSQQEENHE